MSKVRNIFFGNIKKFLIIFLISIIIFIGIVASRGFGLIISYCDGCFITGFIMLAVGCLSALTYFGAFDTFGYSAYALGEMFRRKTSENKKYQDLIDYTEQKRLKRSNKRYSFVPYLENGVFFILAAVILLIFV